MQAYNKEQLQHYFLVEAAKTLYTNKFIAKEQLAEVTKNLLLVKTNGNFLVRTAFFLLGSFLYSSISGTFAIFTLVGDGVNAYKGLLFFYAAIGLIGSELLARSNYFRHGLDDAFILGFQLCFCVAFGALTEDFLVGFVGMVIVGAFCSLRYVHTLSVLVFCIGIVAVCCNLVVEKHYVETLYLPFFGCVLAIGFYLGSQKMKRLNTAYFYNESVSLMKLFSLVLGYFSLNYMVVRELSQNLMQLEILPGKDIPFAYLFYGCTFAIPLFYIFYGIYAKERLFLWIGLFTTGYSIFTIRFYYSLMPLEYAMLLGGIVLFIVAFLGIRYWKNNTEGITFQPDRSSDNKMFRNAQMLIMTTQVQPHAPVASSKMPFGGGGFSGGGAGESF